MGNDPLEIVGEEQGWQINALGQRINNPIERLKQLNDAKGRLQKDGIAEKESAVARLSEAQKQLATLGAGLVKQSLKQDQLEETVEKMRTDIKTLRDVVARHSERLDETP